MSLDRARRQSIALPSLTARMRLARRRRPRLSGHVRGHAMGGSFGVCHWVPVCGLRNEANTRANSLLTRGAARSILSEIDLFRISAFA